MFATDALDVSVVMPCLNEQDSVGACVQKAQGWLESSGLRGEVLVVDNGSTDRSVEVATAAGATVFHETKRGYGNAYRRGFAEARGRRIVMGDSDDTYDFGDLSGLLAPLDQGYDMVLGNRFAGGIERGAMPWAHRYIGSPIINSLIRLFYGIQIGDSQSGFRAFTKTAYDGLGLRGTGMELASEMIVRAANNGLRITEVPAHYSPRVGESKLNTMRDGWRHLRFLLLAAPNFLFILPGALLFLLGILTLAVSFLFPQGLEVGSMNWQPVFAGTILLAIGANALVFGIIAKLYGCARGLLHEDVWVRLYRRYFRLESLLALAAGLILFGLVVDLALLFVWASGSQVAYGLQLAALAQSLLIVGADLAMAGFLVVIVDTA